MTCLHSADGTLHVCFGNTTKAKAWRGDCPTCKRKTPFVGFFQDWYGWMVTCLRCGDSWEDGEMLPRPFCRGWRQESIKHARDRWARWQKREER